MPEPATVAQAEKSSHAAPTKNYLALLLVFVLAGETVRLAQFLSRPAFWEDEIALLINTRDHSSRDLPFSRLVANGEQSPVAAPPLFLLTTKWMGDYFHYAEWSVRLLPFLCSMAAVPLFAHLAWRLAPGAAAVWAMALFTLSDPLIFQAGDVKPYSGDVLAAVLIAWTAMAANPTAPAIRRLIWASLTTAVALWLSYSAVFVFAAVGFALWDDFPGKRATRFIRWLLCLTPAVASFLVVYFLSIRRQRDVNLDVYWVHLFPDYVHPWRIPGWLIGGTWELFHHQFNPIGPIMLGAAGIGAWVLNKRKETGLLTLLVAPVALDLVASFMAQYPYGGTRLTLYLCPFLSLLCGIGAAAAVPWMQAFLATVPLSMAGLAAYGLFVPQSKGNFREAMQFLNQHRRPNETVYLVGNQTIGASLWYWPHPDPLVHIHVDQSAQIHGNTFWVVICYEPRKYNENKPAMSQPDAVADESRSFHISGADVIWFAPKPSETAK